MRTAAMRMGHATVAAGWTPALLTNVVEWWDFSDASKITSSGGAVSNVATSLPSGGHSLVQATGSNQPLTAVDTINSRNVLKFDGVNDALVATSVGTVQPCTILIVAKNTAAAAQYTACMFNNTDGRVFMTSGGLVSMFGGGFNSSATSWGTTNAHQVVADLNGASSNIYVDGGSATTGNAGAQPAGSGNFTVGGRGPADEPWHGDIAEIAITSSSIGSTDRTNWNTYCSRWGL